MIKSGQKRFARSFNLCCMYVDDLIVFNNKKFPDYLDKKYLSQLTVQKAKKSDHLARNLDLIFMTESNSKLSTGFLTNLTILSSMLSIFHSCPATDHMAFLMVYTYCS